MSLVLGQRTEIMKSQDIVVLLKLASLQEHEKNKTDEWLGLELKGEDPYSVRSLQTSLGISKTEVSQAINRSLSSGIALRDRRTGHPRPNPRALLDFILYGFRYAFPARTGAMTRGVPTAFAAPMLKDLLVSGGSYIYVWPHPSAKDLGQSLIPLFKSVPEAALKDERLYEYLALIDAIRLGNQREAGLAGERISTRLYQI